MRATNLKWWVLAVALLVLLGSGVAALFRLRFVAGDIYPPYSSLRADPLGARAFFESLGRLEGMRVERRFAPLARLGPGRGATLLLLGLDAGALMELERREFEALDQFVRTGGRLVLALRADAAEGRAPRVVRGGPIATNAPAPTGVQTLSLALQWRFTWRDGLAGGGTSSVTAVRGAAAPSTLPERLSWRSHRGAFAAQEEWRTLYHHPVASDEILVMERGLGLGTVVLCADAYLFSNEALRRHREAAWLAWVAGEGPLFVFDEGHLGIAEQAGVATLARRYRLHGLLAGLLLLAALWLWRQRTSFVPAAVEPGADAAEVVEGRDVASGLVGLLRRHVPASELLQTCYEEWRRSAGGYSGSQRVRADRMLAVVAREMGMPPRERNPLLTYQELVTILDPPAARRHGRQGANPGPAPLSAPGRAAPAP